MEVPEGQGNSKRCWCYVALCLPVRLLTALFLTQHSFPEPQVMLASCFLYEAETLTVTSFHPRFLRSPLFFHFHFLKCHCQRVRSSGLYYTLSLGQASPLVNGNMDGDGCHQLSTCSLLKVLGAAASISILREPLGRDSYHCQRKQA